MNRLVLILIFLGASQLIQAQDAQKGNGKLSGVVIDASTKEPVEFATVALNDPTTGKPVNGTVVEGKGKFVVKNIPDGKYQVAISFIGYETFIRDVEFTSRNNNIDIGTVSLGTSAQILQEVTVEGQKSLIEEKVDRLVYNAENDATSKGGDATDVLRRVPLLSVDLDGNLSLRGSENIKVLLNGRPSTITAGSVADALKQIPADDIKSVEVITSPSSKYDAEGTTGIINIITKKTVLEGATLNVDGSVGNRGSNLGLRGGYKKGKLGLTLGGWGRSNYNTPGTFENIQTVNSGSQVSTTTQSAATRSNNLFGRYTLGIDYDLNKNNFLTSSVRFGTRGGTDYQDKLLSQTNFGAFSRSSVRDVQTVNRSTSVDVNLNYTHTYAKKDQEFSILGLYSFDDGKNNFKNLFLNPADNSVDSLRTNENPNKNIEMALQADYQNPIGENQMIEMGAKQIIRQVRSDYQYYSAVGEGPLVPLANQSLSNAFNYNQNVSAGYLSYTLNVGKYGAKVGGRYEYTTIDAFFKDEKSIAIPSYGVLVPSVNLSRKLGNGNMLKFGYNRRIQRPSIRFLNPNIQASNSFNISVGNPTLSPEYTDNFELGYTTFIKGTTLNFATFARTTDNSIQQIRDVIGDTIRTSYANIGLEQAYGGSIFANVQIGKKFSLNGGTDFYYSILKNNVADPIYNASNSGWVVSGRMFGNYNLTDDWSLQFFSFVRGRRVQLQGFQGGFYVYSLALRKNLPNKRGSIGFGVENFLGNHITIRNATTSPIIDQQGTTVRQNLNFKVTMNLRFGKVENNGGPSGSAGRRKTISNDDLKAGGDTGGGQDAGGQDAGQLQGAGPGGNRGAYRGATKAAAKLKSNPDAVVEAAGTWTYTVQSPQGGGGTLTIQKQGDGSYMGSILNSRSPRPTALKSVELKGDELSFSYEVSFGGNTSTVSGKVLIKDNAFDGFMTVGQFGTFPMKATRESSQQDK